MLKIFVFILAAVVWAGLATAQMMQPIVVAKKQTAAYVGPGDITSFTAWWGLRAYSAAKAAAQVNALDLRRVSDNATCTAKIGTNGNLDLTVGTPCNGNTQTVTAWIGASTARVSKIYDQTAGNACAGASCDLVQATAGNQPLLNLTGGGGSGTRPYLSVVSQGGAELVSANNYTTNAAQTMSVSIVANRFSGTSTTHLMCANDAFCVATGGANIWTSNMSVTATDNVWHAGNVAKDNAGAGNDVFNLDGSEVTGTGTVALSTTRSRMLRPIGTGTGLAAGEAGFQDATKWSAGTRTSLCNNQRLYWGTPGSC